MQSLNQLLSYVIGGVAFLIVITVLVAVHELGHFWVAKACGMQVDAFAIMMGGRRVTDMRPGLKKPILPSSIPWIAAIVATLVVILGSLINAPVINLVGLVALGIVIPVWVSLRIGALYRMDLITSLKSLSICWAAALALLLFFSKKSGVEVGQVLTIMSLGSGLALMLLYYQPVIKKGESDTMGEGILEVGDETIPVQFRPLACKKSKGGTEFSLLLVPAGGFAAIKGMQPKPDGSETEIEGGFYSKSPIKRLAVLFAGPFFSIAFGVLLLIALFTTVGERQPINEPILGVVSSDAPAAKAGMKVGDRIVEINGVQPKTFYDILSTVRDRADMPTIVVYERGGKQTKIKVTPKPDTEKSYIYDSNLEMTDKMAVQGKLGILWKSHYVRLSLADATRSAVLWPYKMIKGLVSVAKEPSKAKNELGGPGTIAVVAVAAAEEGVTTVLLLAAMLSISLGIMNLLPVPPLDGGQMAVAFVELLRRGRRLSMQVQEWVIRGGMLFVLALTVAILAVDVNRFVGKDKDAKPAVQKSREGGTNPPVEEGKRK